MNKISCIYKITSPTEKIYIGQSYNVHNRILKYQRNHCKGQAKLYKSLKKYGFSNHKFEILQQAPKEQLNQLEMNYIWRYNSMDREKGLNLKEGGYNGNLSEETKDKIRQKAYNRVCSQETQDKMSRAKKEKPFSEEHKLNLEKANQKRCSQKVYRLINNERIIYNSMSEASKLTGICITSIRYNILKNRIVNNDRWFIYREEKQ